MYKALLLTLMLCTGALAWAEDPLSQARPLPIPMPSPGAIKILGQVLQLNDTTLVVKNAFDKEVRLQIDEHTAKIGDPEVGDEVEVIVLSTGYAVSIKNTADP